MLVYGCTMYSKDDGSVLGYLLLKISTKKRYVEEEILVDTADLACRSAVFRRCRWMCCR